MCIRDRPEATLPIVEILLLFIIATVASFIGSLQAGLVNTAVLAHTVQRGPEAGRRLAIGGSIPEVLYAGAASVSYTPLTLPTVYSV